MTPYEEEHAARPAKVVYPMDEWEVFWPALPHDQHSVNEGNTTCPGIEGTIPPTPVAVQEEALQKAQANLAAARQREQDAHRGLKSALARYARAQNLLNFAREQEKI